ncbi:LacI family transcriptional regulator [Pseudolysinimonas kribbensis]|uniref:LacI family transcriptional regulator n=2 Tax=Pseudolysinimonas kribbensis TaxID=433641 RepID=A0ABQ6K481_9MICO|nr:LacI family transcriptional regulator [Pseudolysinimonas kribbensis]
MVLHITEESADVENAVIAGMLEAEPAGAIVIPVQGDASGWTDAGELPFPVVAVAREIPGRDGDFVAMDQHAAMYAATRHALAQGARSLYFFDEDIDTMTNRIRVESFESAVRAVPEASGHVVPMPTRRFENRTSPWQLEEAYRAVSALLESDAAPDAMLFEDDYHAVGALRALAERGVRVPDDVLVIGYSDHPYTAYLQPSLTTVDVPFDLIAEAAVSLLLRRIAGDRTPPLRRLIPGELVVRESSVRQIVDPTPTM